MERGLKIAHLITLAYSQGFFINFTEKMKKLFKQLLITASIFLGVLMFDSCEIENVTENKTELVLCDSIENTEFLVTNNTDDTVNVWLTLGIYTDSLQNYFVQNVSGIFGITDSGAVGTFALAPNDTLAYSSVLALSGNLCFGGPPLNCSTTDFPYSTNIFEFCLNNSFGINPQESVEISCVAGVNSYLIGNLIGNNWEVTQGIDTVRVFRNAVFGENTGLCGVFPTGCTNCTNQAGAPTCTPALPFDKPNDKPICIIQRPAVGSGGQVICTFNGFTPVICSKSK